MKDFYEMLPQQKNIWEIQMTYPDTDICNIGGYLHLKGKYDTALLHKTMEIFLKCNSSFWMKINANGELYFDKIEEYRMKEYDFSDRTKEQTDAMIQKWICEPFSLYDTYLFDFRLIYVQGKILIFQKFHHCIADGYSVLLCAKYQEKIYEQLVSGQTDFEIDERYRMLVCHAKTADRKQADGSRQKEEKKEQDIENNGFVSFVTRALNPAAEILSGMITEGEAMPNCIEWSQKRFPYQKIKEFCRKYRVSVEAMFCGCMAMYLCRVFDADALAIGRNLHGRTGEEFNMTGLFVVTRTFAAEPKWEHPAVRYLSDLKKQLADHAAGKGGCRVAAEIEISYRPIRYLPSPNQGECCEFYNSTVEVPIKIFINEGRFGIELIVKYQKEAAAKEKICHFIEKTLFFMEQILEEPEKSCGSLRLLREDEERQILSAQRGKDWKYSFSLPERFLNIVHKYPNKEAIAWKGGSYSYREFYALVRGVMNLIADRAAPEKERVIALNLLRTPYLPAAVYASWLLGYAFLPISPKETKERRKEIVRHCALCLTDEMLSGLTKPSEIGVSFSPSTPAYEIYTSGTTGMPKAVRISQQSLSCRLEWMEQIFSDGMDTILQKTRSTFDVSIWELALPFAFGKRLYLLEEGKESSPNEIAKALILGKVTMVHFVPSMFERFLFLLEEKNYQFPNLKYCILSGEELGANLVRRAKKLLPDTQIFNLYGPTECTIDVSYYHCMGEEEQIPIGTPVYATNLSVRNKRGEVLPMGERGELVVEGALVGMGYRNQEDSGYAVLEDKRVYWTGDMAVLGQDGLLYYEGRQDAQVKLRGMRMNLTEVERSLNHAVSGTKCIVLLLKERLIAFYEGGRTAEEMKRKAAACLPYYSIPSEFIFVKQLPIKANGKADREKLKRFYEKKCHNKADPKMFSMDWECARREKVLLSVARKHLNRTDITIDDNLLDFGMDSLTVLSFLAECETYGIYITRTFVYEMPYLKALAKESLKTDSEKNGEKEAQKPLVFLQKSGSRRLLLFVPFAGGTPLSLFPLAAQLKRDGIDIAAVNHAAFRGKSIQAMAKSVAALECLKGYEDVFVAGACVGSVAAIQIAELLSGKLGGLLLCEALPNQRNIWDHVPDRVLIKILQKLRGRSFVVERGMLAQFREDVKKSTASLCCMKNLHFNGNIIFVFGKRDLLTLDYEKRVIKWHRWLKQPFRVYGIPKARHFLMEDAAPFLARIIRSELLI